MTASMRNLLSFLREPEELYLEETMRRSKVKRQEIQELRSQALDESDPTKKAELEASVLRAAKELLELAFDREVDGLLEFHKHPDVSKNISLGYVPALPNSTDAIPRINPLGFRFRNVLTDNMEQAVLHLCTDSDDRLVQLQEAKRMITSGELLQAYTTMRSRFHLKEINLLLARTLADRMGASLFVDLHTVYDYTT